MIKFLNLGNKESAIVTLEEIKNKKVNNYDIRIQNSHITKLNKVIGRRVFKKDALYISSDTLWEIMCLGGEMGKHHHHHGLTPKNIYDALSTMKNSTEVVVSYDGRFIIVTLAKINDVTNLVVIVSPNEPLKGDIFANVTKIITIYPKDKK